MSSPSIAVTSSPIITTDIKQKPIFKQHLANLAKSDAHHDLKEVLTSEVLQKQNISNAFNSGIPEGAMDYYDELGSLASVIFDINSIPINSSDKLSEQLNIVSNVTLDPNIQPTPLQIGLNKDNIFFNYSVVQFVMTCSNNSKKGITSYNGTNFGMDFFQNTKLGGASGTDAAFIVDFSQHGFMENLVQNDVSNVSPYNCHYLMTPEVVNDPAGKQNVHNSSLFKTNTGINLYSYVEFSPTNIYYNKYNPYDVSPSNNFFSNYNFTLSHIKQTFTKQKAEKLITDLTISYDWDTKSGSKPLVDVIEDSKGENSNKTVMGFLKKMIERIRDLNQSDPNKVPLYFNFNSKCQQKRGGDWFQILACLDAKNRKYTQILPDNGRKQINLPIGCPVYLVTHDRIAVSFALLNGVNVIYVDYYGRIFVFKNSADNSTIGNGKPIEEIIFDNMKTNFIEPNISELILNSQKYNDIISHVDSEDDALKLFFDITNNMINNVDDINQIDVNNDKFITLMSNQIKKIFHAAIKRCFYNLNLINITNEIEICNNNKDILLGVYGNDKNSSIMVLNKAINTLVGIRNKFGLITDTTKFRNGLGTFLNINSMRLEVYRCVEKLFEGRDSDLETMLIPESRLVNIISGIKDTDRYIFLPFIQQLDDEFKGKVIESLINVSYKIIQYLSHFNPPEVGQNNLFKNILNTIKIKISNRSGRLNKELIYYNRVANLLYQSFLFLDNKGLTQTIRPEIIEDINVVTTDISIVSDSTDNIVLMEDIQIIGSLANGVVSGDTSEDVISGGGFEFFNVLNQPKQNSNTICDVSVKQVTWNLISSYLINDKNIIYELFHTINTAEEYGESGEDEDKAFPNDSFAEIVNNIYRHYLNIKKGGSPEIIVEESNPSADDNLLQNFNLGYHPLVPIYAVLSPFYYSLGPKYDSHPFFNTYFTYFNVLEKMVDIIDRNYLNNASDKNKIIAGYCLGYCLKFFLFTSNTNILQNNKILEVIGISQKDYYTFSLKNDIFANLMVGTIYLNHDDEQKGIMLLESELFKNFINNEVNIKQILQQGTPIDNLPTYEILQDRVLSLLTRIVVKVNIDRGTPQNNEFLAQQVISVVTPESTQSDSLSSPATQAYLERKREIEEMKSEGKYIPPLPQEKTGSQEMRERQAIPLSERTIKISSSPSSGNENEITSSLDSNSSSSPYGIRSGGKKTRKHRRHFKNKRTKRRNSRTRRRTTKKHKRARKNNRSRK